jgi:hypothetical protein
LVPAISAAVCIAISALLHNCSIISCSGLPGLCDLLRSDSSTTVVWCCNCEIFCGVCRTIGLLGARLSGVDCRTLRCFITTAGSNSISPVPLNAL